ncbi:MAG: hypothetical protein FGF48_09235 [Candidatus Brockarchaeota archaeon]|nr:hypothetical protein [Candidatus Brockarchaeota archaeon]
MGNSAKMFRVRVSVSSGKPGLKRNREIDFTSLLLALGFILVVLSVIEMLRIPIIHVTGGVRYELFTIGSPVVPYLVGITVVPLVLENAGRVKHVLVVAIMGMVLLVDFTFGYSYSLPFSVMLWAAILFPMKRVLRLNKILQYSVTLATIYVCLVGLHVLISPLVPMELPFLGKFTEVLWKAYSILRWPAILLYTLLPYALLTPLFHGFIRSRKPDVSMNPEEFFRREILSGRALQLILIASMGLATYLAAYNYLPRINPSGFPTGVDTVYYYAPSLRRMINSSDPIRFAFSEPFASTRPFYMLFLYSIHRLTGLDFLQTVESAPIILLPLLVASYYLLASRLFNLRSMGALAAVLTLAGIQTSVGIFTSYQANFLGLIVANLLAVLTLTVNSRKAAYPLVSLLSFCLMLIHSWTSIYYVATISVALAYCTARGRGVEGLVRIAIIVAFALLSTPFVNMMQQPVEGSTDPLHAAQATLIPIFSLENLQEYWLNTHSLFTQWFRGFMANAFLYILAIIGIMRIGSTPEPAKTFLAVFPLTLFPLPLVNYVLGSRLYFNMPLQLYASIAIYPMLQDNSVMKRMISIFSGCLALVYSILAVANTGFFPIGYVAIR